MAKMEIIHRKDAWIELQPHLGGRENSAAVLAHFAADPLPYSAPTKLLDVGERS